MEHIIVATGQCGNQLGYELIDRLYAHAFNQPKSNHVGTVVEDAEILKSSLFRETGSDTSTNQGKHTARVVCLDTEPKVIKDCMVKTKRNNTWLYDPKSVAYMHGGAGNNWALGYSMASGDFLDISMNCIRREIEHCDTVPVLTFIHSLAGGTGSGLGTRITEEANDLFNDCFRSNIAVAPHHFGEVIVQHYNALLCLSKIYDYANGVIIFENETAQRICKQMKSIEKPLLQDLNEAIAGTLLPLFTPRRSILSDPYTTSYHHFYDDLTLLCSHPRYRLLSVRFTPQTSKKSIAYTYDSWNTLLKTIQKLQLSGAPTESFIPNELRSDTMYYNYHGSPRSRDSIVSITTAASTTRTPPQHYHNNNSSDTSPSSGKGGVSPGMNGDESIMTTTTTNGSDRIPFQRSLGSVITCYGETAQSAAQTFQENLHASFASPPAQSSSAPSITPTKYGKASSEMNTNTDIPVLPYFTDSYASLLRSTLLPSSSSSPVYVKYSELFLNQYQRSASIVSNDQAIIPVLKTSKQKSVELYKVRAYLHQYTSHGLEEEDFITAFQSIEDVIMNYDRL